MTTVTLTPQELSIAAYVGVRRSVSAKARGREQAHGFAGGAQGWAIDCEGAAAELAVAKLLGRYWPMTIARLDLDGDVDGGIHVRSTTRPDGSLILHPNDPDGDRFYLVTGEAPTFRVPGSILAGAGKIDTYWREGDRPAYFIPQSALDPPTKGNP